MSLPAELILKLSIQFENCYMDREKIFPAEQSQSDCSEINNLKYDILRAQFKPNIRSFRFNRFKERLSFRFLMRKNDPPRGYNQLFESLTNLSFYHTPPTNKTYIKECLEHFLHTHQLTVRKQDFILKRRIFEQGTCPTQRRVNNLAPSLRRIACFLEFQLKRWNLERRQLLRI